MAAEGVLLIRGRPRAGMALAVGLGAMSLMACFQSEAIGGNVPTRFPPLAYAALSCQARPPASVAPGSVVVAASPQCASAGRIYVDSGDVAGPHRVTDPAFENTGPGSGVIDRAPSWSGRGQIAFERQTSLESSRIYVVNEDGSGERFLTFGREPDWSPDSTSLLYWRTTGCPRACRGQIMLMQTNGSAPRPLTPARYDAQSPSFSPDGRNVAYVRILPHGRFDLYVLRLSDRHMTRLTRTEQDEFSPSWSPDGRRLVFARETRPRHRTLFTVSPRGGHPVRLLRSAADMTDPSWSPAGIAFSRRTGSKLAIWVRSPDGARISQLPQPPGADAREPTWRSVR